MSIKERIYYAIQRKIESMIEQHKFHFYQLKYYPNFYRGIESGKYQNTIYPNYWDTRIEMWEYNFTFNYFFEQRQTEFDTFRVTLHMEYWPGEEDFLKIRLKFGESHHLGFTFHYEHLLSKGYSLEEILEDFENIFLELRFCERWFSNKYLLFTSKHYLEEQYEKIENSYHQQKMEDQRLALAMFSHERLAANSLTKSIPKELLPMIAHFSLSTNRLKKW